MADRLTVLIGEWPAGTLTRLSGGALRLDYDPAYQARHDATPLSSSMATSVPRHGDSAITPWLWGLLPDNEAVLARWGRAFHASLSTPFALLASPVGEDCAGAVRFAAAGAEARSQPDAVEWLTEDDVATRLRELRRDATAWLGATTNGRFSLAGAQAKTALLSRDGRWGVPSGSVPTSHILKPAIAGLDDHDLNEHLCLDAARRAGLTVARTRVERFADITAIVVDRYDRRPAGAGRVVRVHQEDVCQALGLHPSRKYQSDGGPGPQAIADLMRRAMSPAAARDGVLRFADALIWNWLILGTDAHAKNYSLLLSGDQVRLAPLYDVASALPYGDSEHALRFAMKLGSDYRVVTYRNPWPAVARDLRIDAEALVARARVLCDVAAQCFADAGSTEGVRALRSALPARLADLVAERAGRCARILADVS